VPLPGGASVDAIPAALERCAAELGLTIALRSTLRSYAGSVHWHLRREGRRGTLEATLWPSRPRLWLKTHSGRAAAWIEPAAAQLRARLADDCVSISPGV
jgi:hypothetical protein